MKNKNLGSNHTKENLGRYNNGLNINIVPCEFAWPNPYD